MTADMSQSDAGSSGPNVVGVLQILIDHAEMSVDTRAKAQAYLEGQPYPAPPEAAPPDPRDAEIEALKAQLAAQQSAGQSQSTEAAPQAEPVAPAG